MLKVSGSPRALIDRLKAAKKNFEVRKTTKSTLVKFDSYSYMFADSHFKDHYLNLFQRIKKEVRENIKKKELIPPEIHKSKYFKLANFEPIGLGEFLKFSDCYEFDLNKAYYRALFILGYISEEFYNYCIELPKAIRLALVGTLATQKTIFYYVDGELDSFETVKDDILRRVFFHLVEYVDRALNYFGQLASDNFLFYWVDGIYLKNYSRAERHRQLISDEFNLDFSSEPIKEVLIYNKGEYNTQIVIKKSDDTFKTFNLNNIFVENNNFNYGES